MFIPLICFTKRFLTNEVKYKMGEKCGSCCSPEDSKGAEELVKDLINLIEVYKKEGKEDVLTRIDKETAEELIEKLEELAVKIGGVCE